MALYVIPVPQPAAGVDWQYTVPGQYIEHITAISAQCNPAGTTPTVAIDSSGGGHDLTYEAGQVTYGIAGYVSGDTMVQQTGGPSHYVATGPCPMTFLTANDLFFVAWNNGFIAAGTGPNMVAFVGATNSLMQFALRSGGAGTLAMNLSWFSVDFTVGGATSLGGIPAGPHMYGVRYDLAGNQFQFYVDGAPHGGLIPNGGVAPNMDADGTILVGGDPNTVSHPFYDEVAAGGNPTTDADFATLYARAGDFALYTSWQLSMGPEVYYHLDELSSGPQRQVTLDITDGTHTVLEVPTGFAESPNPGTFAYSWQPNLNSSTQTPDKITTTVAVPDLILPAGYTIGTRTLDLDPGDQWADIFIWWNSDIMDSSPILNPIDYPPGAYLVIVPQGV